MAGEGETENPETDNAGETVEEPASAEEKESTEETGNKEENKT